MAILFAAPARAADVPEFQVDPSWPKPLPNNWIIGQVGGLFVDDQDHVWIIHRPRLLTASETGAVQTPPRSKCCVPAPPVIEFDAEGNVVQAWGGPAAGYDWPQREHGIYIDPKGFAWLGGNLDGDGAILKFTRDGKFVMQIGHAGPTKGSNDPTQLDKPANFRVDPATNEIFVADGYGNRRVIVFDAETGAYKRHWSAYGHHPDDAKAGPYDPSVPPSPQFANPVHCALLARDGLLYVCDRSNDRVQVFHTDGTFVTEWFYEKATRGAGSVWDLTFWPRAEQTFLLNADGENNEVRILRRSDGAVLGTFGRQGRSAGQFHWVHAIAVDSKGNVYTGEVDNGERVQKFRPLNGKP
jgi:hypothetical protein